MMGGNRLCPVADGLFTHVNPMCSAESSFCFVVVVVGASLLRTLQFSHSSSN
jgi:hypothetical protein